MSLVNDERAAQAERLAQALHADPEISLQEVRSSARCQELLASWGFDVKAGVAGLDTAFRAEFVLGSGEGPTLGLVAEFDALPDVGHACGHHLIAGGVLEAAGRLASGEVPGDGIVRVLGTPGEELFAGKAPMLEAGAFDGVDAVITYHPLDGAGVFRTLSGTAIIDLTFHGVSAHAATNPWAGRSAQDGAMIAAEALSMERQYMVEGCRIHSIITEVVGAHNIIPSKAVLRVNVRALTDEVLDRLRQRAIEIANGAAMATATTVEIELAQIAKPYKIHEGLAHLAWEAMDLPEGTCFDVGGSTDLGDVSVALPTVTVTESGWEPTTWHSRDLHDAAGTEGAYASMHRAADAMVGVSARILAGAEWR